MRESLFIKKNQMKWSSFELHLASKTALPPSDLADLYLEISDDLNYARTFYPEGKAIVYLNHLASQYHREVYRDKKMGIKGVMDFYTRDFPLMFYRYLPQLGISFFVFALFALMGAYSAQTDISFVRSILGDSYVNQTLANIDSGDPMAVYKKMNQMDMFMGITVNNIRVAIIAFVAGIFLGVGTLLVLLYNGVMLGSFQYFFHAKGLLWESARTIWIHGTIEISVIVIAGCAGLVLGNGILFPGTFSRLHSFRRGMKDGLKILMSTIPFFVIAGFLESFVTRLTQMPDVLSVLIILGSLALIVFYYVYLPVKLFKKPNVCSSPISN
ncbi:stage II sporulation protein M [Algoriphagus sp. AGSA1]|uniref:stage II sporulation protein M n=1 Tax=Algoriphagus sp. AGSA1 TaxID=2907213 RepID=UPI001F216323|nr:stage II sporulation protein M [Algoriphagus sp. AGSA1]MCE7054327.1 stage II sporulation protein M [Algoriphagus sp. AGSA1]